MESMIVEVLKFLFQRTDPILGSCLIAILIMLYKVNKKVDGHLDIKNKEPHPQCLIHGGKFEELREDMRMQHTETREAIETSRERTREDLQELSNRIDKALLK